MIKGTITGETWTDADGEDWSFTLHQFGNIGGTDCENVGPEFNPLAEFIYGEPNTFADPSRGTINDVTIIETPDNMITPPQEFSQDKFMQNLGGENSIIGKSIKATRMRENMSTMELEEDVLGCCVIG